jgi:RNA polymerase sigma-70 factor, ECF subfamily
MHATGDYDLARDIMQESFTRYLTRYGQKNGIPALLYAIARNALFDAHRRQRHVQKNTPDDIQASDVHPEHDVVMRDECRRVIDAMQMLDPDDRDLLALVVTRQLSYREVAHMVGCSEGNVKVRVHRTRLKLRQMLQAGER